MNEGLKLYYDYTISPLGELFYKTLWSQLEDVKNKKVLDFGSGFAFTSDFLAQNNEVVALEIDEEIIKYAKKDNTYNQVNAGLEYLKSIEDNTFDFIVCHLVFEFVENPEIILDELIRVLKKDGSISIVRHNRNGRIIQAITQLYDLEEAKKLLDGGYSYSSAFGDIKYYDNDDIVKWSNNKLSVDKVCGIRCLASLHNSEIQKNENWIDEMFEVELKLLQKQEFIDIAYFNHVLLKKI